MSVLFGFGNVNHIFTIREGAQMDDVLILL